MTIIGSVLDQVQKLFSRSFIVASFLPTLVFVVVCCTLWFGWGAVETAWKDLETTGLDKAAYRTVLLLGVVYIVSYIVYSVRSALYQFFQGRWPWPLRWLSSLFLEHQRRIWAGRDRRCELSVNALNIPTWVTRKEDPFGRNFSPYVLTPRQARALLKKAIVNRGEIARELKEGRKPSANRIDRLFQEAYSLQASRKSFTPYLQSEIDLFVADVHAMYARPESSALRDAVTALEASLHIEWNQAHEDLVQYFPQDARWLKPTRLGNVAVAQELYGRERYGIPIGDLWPRLLPFLPQDATKRIDDASAFLDFAIIMAFYSALAVAFTGRAAFFEGPLQLSNSLTTMTSKILFTLSPLLSCWLFYHLAVEATRGLGLQMQTAVDLYRLKLIDALGIVRPKTMEEEKKIWDALWSFFTWAQLPGETIKFKEPVDPLPKH